jgi:iron(III) transport system permease protein
VSVVERLVEAVSPAAPTRAAAGPPIPVVARVAAFGAVALVLLPLAGLVLAWLNPPGLFDPPPIAWDSLGPLSARTLALAGLVATVSCAAGTWLAWVHVRADYPLRRAMAIASVLPLAVPSYLLAAIVRESFAPRGALGALLGSDGPFTGFWASALVLTVGCTPYAAVIVAATLERLPASEVEAARSLGASGWRRFTRIVAPRLRPAWALSLVIVTLYVVSDFGAVAVLDCEVLTWAIYRARGARDAVLMGVCVLAIVLPMLAASRWLHGRVEPDGETPLGATRELDRRPLAWPAALGTWLLHGVLVGLGVVLPVVTLVTWVRDGLANGHDFAAVTGPLADTAWFTTVGAALTVGIALAPAYFAGRRATRVGAAIDHGVHVTSSLPGILVAFGVLQLIVALKRHAPAGDAGALWALLEGAGVFLFAAYVMRFLAVAYDALKPVVMRLDPRLDESARSLGASAARRFWRVTVPQLAPGLAAAYLLVFLGLAKELPITVMLTPIGSQTLAYRIFDGQQEGSLPDVGLAGSALLLAAVAVFLVVRTVRRRDTL